MNKRNIEPEEHSNSERWLLTYSDLITLLLVFFIVMYTISSVNAKKFSQVAASLNQAMAGQATGMMVGEAPGPAMVAGVGVTSSQTEQTNLEKAKSQIEQYAKAHGLEGKIIVSLDERGLVISLKEALLFDSGSARLEPAANNALANLAKIIIALPNRLRIEGNTDDIPIHTSQFPSNWYLSTNRAINVVEFLVNQASIKPERLSAIGYGEFRPIVPNNSVNNRAKNRRVDIVVLKQALNLAETGGSK